MKEFKLNNDEMKELTDIKGSCIATDRITVDGMKIGYMYRDNPANGFDTGWRFFEGNEDEEYTNNPDNFEIYELNTICNYDPSIIPYLSKPIGTKLEKNGNSFVDIK